MATARFAGSRASSSCRRTASSTPTAASDHEPSPRRGRRRETVMTDRDVQPYAAFRLDLEQQHERAKDLLEAAKAGALEALRRLHGAGFPAPTEPKLAHARDCIARELRLASWADLKRHVGDMQRTRHALWRRGARRRLPPCTSAAATTSSASCAKPGCTATSTRTSNSLLAGPRHRFAHWVEQRARFIADAIGPYLQLEYAKVLEGARRGAASRPKRAATTRASCCGSSTIVTTSSCCCDALHGSPSTALRRSSSSSGRRIFPARRASSGSGSCRRRRCACFGHGASRSARSN